MSNPFFHGNPVSPAQFLDRRRELRRVVSRILNEGQSSAVVGEPRTGKTSLLEYLAASETRVELYGTDMDRLLFTYLDAQTLGVQFSQAQFWEYALRPLYEQVIVSDPETSLAQAYAICKENHFGTFVLERLLVQMEQRDWRLVLMLDEFDVLLQHPILNSAEFFGSLRSLVSRSRGALALIIASRLPLENLNKETQELSRTGSPYFNFLIEIALGAWPESSVDELLRWAGERFTPADRRFLKEVAGGHPYLLQTAASLLWEAYEEGQGHEVQRRRHAGRDLYDQVSPNLQDTWRLWSPDTRKAIAFVSLAHIQTMSIGAGDSTPAQLDVAVVCDLMRDAFTAKDLMRFCRDRAIFSPVQSRFGPSPSLEDVIDGLVEYCQKRLLFPELLSEIRLVNPRQYERYLSQLEPPILRDLVDLDPELRFLERQGFVAKDLARLGGYCVRPLVLLWWLADELGRAMRSPDLAGEWWRELNVCSPRTSAERVWLEETSRAIVDAFPGGATDLIELAIEAA